MKKLLLISVLLLANTSYAKSGFNEQEKLQQQIEQNRKEVNDSVVAPNQKSTPYVLPVIKDDGTRYEITNHFFGASTLIEQDQTLVGVKFTGMLNLAYYNVSKKEDDGKRKKGRFIVGFEIPVIEYNRTAWFGGLGGSLGDQTGVYVNGGFDYHLTSWSKIQAGLNYNTGGGLSPMLNLGLTW